MSIYCDDPIRFWLTERQEGLLATSASEIPNEVDRTELQKAAATQAGELAAQSKAYGIPYPKVAIERTGITCIMSE